MTVNRHMLLPPETGTCPVCQQANRSLRTYVGEMESEKFCHLCWDSFVEDNYMSQSSWNGVIQEKWYANECFALYFHQNGTAQSTRRTRDISTRHSSRPPQVLHPSEEIHA